MISIDVGFGNVKVFDGKNIDAFPSVYKEASISRLPQTDNKDMILTLDGKSYHVGVSALNMSGVAPFNKEDMNRHKVFMLTAICKVTKGDWEGDVAAGLPIGDYNFMADKLAGLKGEYDVTFNGKNRHINIKNIHVFPQAEAVFNLLASEDDTIRNKKIGIIDVGQKTVDFAYFVDSTFVRERSGSMEQGVINAYQQIAIAVEDKLGFEIEDYEARRYISDVQDDSNRAFETMANSIKSRLIRRKWNFKEMDAVYIIGGGAGYIEPYFSDAPVVHSDDALKTVFANAYGFYKEVTA